MAKIYGVQLKSVKMHMTSDGYATYANIYLNNKKVGAMHDDGVGAGMWADFVTNEDGKILTDIAKRFYEKNPTYFIESDINDFGILLNFLEEELLLLHDIEKEYKANSKKGYTVTLLLQTHNRNENPFAIRENYDTPLILGVTKWDDDMKKHIRNKYPKYKNITVYSSLEDFIIEE